MNSTADPIVSADAEFIDGELHSKAFDDSYFMPGQGLAESQAVFIEGNQLQQRFSSLKQNLTFVIGENGFGSGLNALLAAECFERHAESGSRLRIFSTEKHPLRHADLERALSPFPSLARWAHQLIGHYPAPVPGYHRIALSDRVDLILMYGDAAALWTAAEVKVDAWFLDGFTPACNPLMWSGELFKALARRSRPGATLSTFTAAGTVRRGLQAAGFDVSRVKGFAHKRHRLAARWPGHWKAAGHHTGEALVAGAGLAGATTARALAERGWRVRVIDRSGPASGASGNHAGVLYTTPSAHLTPQNRFYQTAFVRAQSWLQRHGFPHSPAQGRLNDVIQYPTSDKHRDKLLDAMHSGAWPGELLSRRGDLSFVLHGGGYLHPAAWIEQLLDHPSIELQHGELQSIEDGGIARLADGRRLACDALVLCLAHHAATLPGLDWLFIKTIRGQVSECAETEASAAWAQAICHGGYLTPSLNGRHSVGATYDLKRPDHGIDPDDDRINLEQLKSFLPDQWSELGGPAISLLGQRAAVRCQSLDFLPQAGPLPDPQQLPHRIINGVYLNIGHGSRGLTHTPLTADLLADQLTGLPISVEPDLKNALAPERFVLRRRKRDPAWQPP